MNPLAKMYIFPIRLIFKMARVQPGLAPVLSLATLVILTLSARADQTVQQHPTICNPLDLAYRFELSGSFREAADPTAIYFHGQYWIFASKSGGYWHSPDFIHWG